MTKKLLVIDSHNHVRTKWLIAGAAFTFYFLSPPCRYRPRPFPTTHPVGDHDGPGDSLDLTGRAISAELSKILKTPVMPVNKAGAGEVWESIPWPKQRRTATPFSIPIRVLFTPML